MATKHSEARKEQWRSYHKRNKTKRNEKAKEKITCECGSTFAYSGKTQHNRSKKHIKYVAVGKSEDTQKKT